MSRSDRILGIDPTHVIATGLVVGHLLARYPDAVLVGPSGNGSHMLATYPAELVTPAELRHGLHRPAPQNSLMRHVRSAYDVAGRAHVAIAARRASKPAGHPSR